MADKKSIDYFPGMPKFTAYVKDLGYRFRLVKEESDLRATDEAAYEVYFGDKQMGRFKVRRNGNLVERNLLLTYPNGQIVSFGGGGTTFDDLLRQIDEWVSIAQHRLRRKKITSAN